DDAGLDVGKQGQLRRKRQPCRSAADDQDIDLLGNRTLRTGGRISLRRVDDLRVTRLETVQVKLHDPSLSLTASAAVRCRKNHRRIRLTIRQRTRVLEQWPRGPAPDA